MFWLSGTFNSEVFPFPQGSRVVASCYFFLSPWSEPFSLELEGVTLPSPGGRSPIGRLTILGLERFVSLLLSLCRPFRSIELLHSPQFATLFFQSSYVIVLFFPLNRLSYPSRP